MLKGRSYTVTNNTHIKNRHYTGSNPADMPRNSTASHG